MDLYKNPWTYRGETFLEVPKGIAGFVYEITDLVTGKRYIGKKFVTKLRKVEGKTRRVTSESDWRRYYSSNDFIKKEAKADPERFRREILHLCKTKGETNWVEVEEQITRRVLRSEDYLNDNISGKWFKKNIIRY